MKDDNKYIETSKVRLVVEYPNGSRQEHSIGSLENSITVAPGSKTARLEIPLNKNDHLLSTSVPDAGNTDTFRVFVVRAGDTQESQVGAEVSAIYYDLSNLFTPTCIGFFGSIYGIKTL